MNLLGTIYAVACTCLTGQYQIYVSMKQKELGLNSSQLLSAMIPVSTVIVFLLIPFLDSTGVFFYQKDALINFPLSAVGPGC